MTQRMPMISTIVDDSHVISTSVGTYCFSTSMVTMYATMVVFVITSYVSTNHSDQVATSLRSWFSCSRLVFFASSLRRAAFSLRRALNDEAVPVASSAEPSTPSPPSGAEPCATGTCEVAADALLNMASASSVSLDACSVWLIATPGWLFSRPWIVGRHRTSRPARRGCALHPNGV